MHSDTTALQLILDYFQIDSVIKLVKVFLYKT